MPPKGRALGEIAGTFATFAKRGWSAGSETVSVLAIMLFDPARVAEHLHGHLGWLAAASLTHPALLLRQARRRADAAVALSVVMATLGGAMGVVLYPQYRERLRQPLFASAPALGYLFERKEHLAFGAIFFAWTGAAIYVGARFRCADVGALAALQRAAHWAFVAAAVLALATAALGTIVASYCTF